MATNERIIVLIDMDCFYVQVEQRRDPEIRGKPCAVVQYNKWKGGGIIAVSYEARAKGVTRNMRGDDAKEKCPDIILCMVPTANGKADLTRYRDAGAEVIQVLLQFSGIVERASVDEAYIDLTEVVDEKITKYKSLSESLPLTTELEHTHIVGYPKDSVDTANKSEERLRGLIEYMKHADKDRDAVRLLIAASIVEEMRAAIYEQTTFRCSAGISHNKVLSKLSCGINKPNKQTILPMDGVPDLFKSIKIGKIRNLGGKLGHQLSQDFGIEFIGQLTRISLETLIQSNGQKTGEWLYEICRGIDHEEVKERHLAQSVGCSKTFRGDEMLNTRTKVKHWIGCLMTELIERLARDREMNNRTSAGLTVYVDMRGRRGVSRSCPITKYDAEDINQKILNVLELLNESKDRNSDSWYPAITTIGISAGKFKSNQGAGMKKTKLTSKKRSMDAYMSPIPRSAVSHPGTSDQTNQSRCLGSENQAEESSPEAVASNNRSKITGKEGVEEDESATSRIVSARSNKRSERSKSSLEAKRSFFDRMNDSGDKEAKPCKIEAAFGVPVGNNKKATDVEVCHRVDHKEHDLEKKEVSLPQSAAGPYTQRNNESVGDHYDMKDVDMDVFNSLPLYLQQEIKFTCQKTTASKLPQACVSPQSKRRKMAPQNGQISISGFLNPIAPSFEKKPASNSRESAKKSLPTKSTVKRKDSRKKGKQEKAQLNSTDDAANALPLGFFRARTQASAAIRSAVEQYALTSQRRKNESGNTQTKNKKINETNSTGGPAASSPTKTSEDDLGRAGKSLWSSIVNEDTYICDLCKANVPTSQRSDHNQFHVLRDLL